MNNLINLAERNNLEVEINNIFTDADHMDHVVAYFKEDNRIICSIELGKKYICDFTHHRFSNPQIDTEKVVKVISELSSYIKINTKDKNYICVDEIRDRLLSAGMSLSRDKNNVGYKIARNGETIALIYDQVACFKISRNIHDIKSPTEKRAVASLIYRLAMTPVLER